MTEPVWIVAPTSGMLHIAGDGYTRRECKPGIRLLCGWVLTSDSKDTRLSKLGHDLRNKAGQKCRGCSAWIRTHGAPE